MDPGEFGVDEAEVLVGEVAVEAVVEVVAVNLHHVSKISRPTSSKAKPIIQVHFSRGESEEPMKYDTINAQHGVRSF